MGSQNIPVIAGHDLSSREVGGEKFVAIISDRFVEKLFPGIAPQQALGREIKIQLNQGDYTFTVSGVSRYEVTGFAANMTGDTTTNIFIPIGAAEQILSLIHISMLPHELPEALGGLLLERGL